MAAVLTRLRTPRNRELVNLVLVALLTVAGFTAVGVTEIILIVAADPVAQAERVAALLPELRGLAPARPS